MNYSTRPGCTTETARPRTEPDPLITTLLAMWPGTRKALARRLDVNFRTISGWHLGHRTPTLTTIRALAEAVGVTVEIRPRGLSPCGTPAAYERHRRRGEDCPVCRPAMRPVWTARKQQRRQWRPVA